MGEVAAIQNGRELSLMGVWGILITHKADPVTTQSKAFKYVMVSEPYTYTLYLKQVIAYITINFLTLMAYRV
jgi:hypothetical protein